MKIQIFIIIGILLALTIGYTVMNSKQNIQTNIDIPINTTRQPSITGSGTVTNAATPTATKSFTLQEVVTHKNASSCWSIVNGNVYDLTSWIDRHPGGSRNILRICGTDGSSAFNDQHEGQRRPANELSQFIIGTFKK